MEINEYLEGNSYPGRLIIGGFSRSGHPVLAYAIMGRSPRSRNRIFTLSEEGDLSISKHDDAMEGDSLTIYPPLFRLGDTIVLANGDHSIPLRDAIESGSGIESALARIEYEPDSPSYTPRIMLVQDGKESVFAIARKSGEGTERVIYRYPLRPGKAHVIHTYDGDGDPLPSFSRRMLEEIDLPYDIDSFAGTLWKSLDKSNRVSLFVETEKGRRVFNQRQEEERRIDLKYGLNPNQKVAYIESEGRMPLSVLNGRPGYINLLDALNGYQLVSELKNATGMSASASFKHVSPAGAAIGKELSETERRMYFIPHSFELSPLASSYARARGADRMSSFGDFISLSDVCDEPTARLIQREVSDGVIAPGYTKEALEILKGKKNGGYLILRIDPDYVPEELEKRSIYGMTLAESHNGFRISDELFANIVTRNRDLTEDARRDLAVGMLALKYTQSNSICCSYNGQTIGIGAGQQSRIHCTRLAGSKADLWNLRHSEKVLSLPFLPKLSRNTKDNVIEQYLSEEPEEDVIASWEKYFTVKPDPFTLQEKREYLSSVDSVSLSSDAFFPFRDNIDRAFRSGVRYIAEPGGSTRDDLVIEAADEHGIVMAFTSARLFLH